MARNGLSAEQVQQFARSGIHFPVRVLDQSEAQALVRQIEQLERAEGGQLSKTTSRKPHLLLTNLAALIRDSRILDAIEDLLGPSILCWGSDFFIKNPGDGKVVTWHQDSTYWGLTPPDIVTAWIALTPSTRESGCLRVIPGSHLCDQLPHRRSDARNNMLSRGQEVEVEVDEMTAIDVELKPGEASIHHVRLIHGSGPNQAAIRRIGFVARYLPTHVRQSMDGQDSATLVRGTDRYRNFIHESVPQADFHPDAVAMHAKVIDAQARILLSGVRIPPSDLPANADRN